MSARPKSLSLRAELEDLAAKRAAAENRTFSGYVQHLIKRDLAKNGTPYADQPPGKRNRQRAGKLA